MKKKCIWYIEFPFESRRIEVERYVRTCSSIRERPVKFAWPWFRYNPGAMIFWGYIFFLWPDESKLKPKPPKLNVSKSVFLTFWLSFLPLQRLKMFPENNCITTVLQNFNTMRLGMWGGVVVGCGYPVGILHNFHITQTHAYFILINRVV